MALGGVTQTAATHRSTNPVYSDNSSLSFSVSAGDVAEVDITYSTGYTYGTVVWVDWNSDFTFSEDEVVFKGTASSTQPTTLHCEFEVPAAQELGTYRLRIGGADSQFDSFVSGSTSTVSACLSTTYTVYEDYSITVIAPASCPKPTGLALDGEVETDEAWIVWNIIDGAESYELQYSLNSNFEDAESNLDAEEDAEMIITGIDGLTPATTYYVRVRAFCGGEDYSEWSSTFSFTTKCVPVSVASGWSENFNDLTVGNDIDLVCWKNEHISGGGSKLFQIAAASSASADSKVANLPDMTSGTITDLTLPDMEIHAENAYEFLIDVYRNTNSSSYAGEGLRIFAVKGTDSTELGFISRNYTQSSTIDEKVVVPAESASGWYTYNFTIPYAGTVNIVVRGESKFGSATYFDNLVVRELPACLKPSGLAFVSATTTSAVLNWEAGESGESAWDIYYSTENVAPTAETVPSIEGATEKAIADGLNPSTTYYVWLRAHCNEDDRSDWIGGISFQTECEAVSALSENFDSYDIASAYTPTARVLPVCWSAINTSTSSDYKWYPTMYYNSYTDYSHSPNNSLRFYSYYSSWSSSYDPQPQYAIMPVMNFETNKRIVFWARGYNESSTIKIGRMTDPEDASTFVQIGEEIALTTSYQKFTINLTGEGNYIAIMIDAATSSRTYNGAYIDDIVVEDIPACMEPSDLAFVSSDLHSAVLSWNASESGESSWDIYYTADNVAPTAETAPSIEGTTEKEIPSGLNASSTYKVWVRAHCDEVNRSAWVGGISFATECEAITVASGWSEDFNGYEAGATSSSAPSNYPEDQLPTCWQFLNRATTTSNHPQAFISSSSSYAVSGNCLFFTSSSATPLYAILPEFVENTSALQLAFAYRNEGTGSSNGTLYVGYLTDPADASTFVSVHTCEQTTTLTEQEVFFTGAPDGSRIAFKYQGGSSSNYYMSIDDVFVSPIPSCQPLASISFSDIKRRSMKINLQPKAGVELADKYDLVFSTSALDNEALELAEKKEVTAATYEIDGLERETKYYIYVRANCGLEDGVSAWVCDSAKTKALNGCDDLQIGAGTVSANLVYTSYGNTYSQHIYTAEELIAAGYQQGVLSAVQFEYSGEYSSYDKIQSVYIGTTEKSSFAGYAVSDFVGDLTLAYGPTELEYQKGWREYAFDTPFVWDGESNIVVGMLTNSTASSASGWSANGVSGSITRSICRYKDNTLIDVTNLASTTSYGTTSTNRPNIKFSFCYEVEACPAVSEMAFELVGDGTTEANVSWEISGADYLSGFDVILSDTAIVEFEGVEITVANHQDRTINFNALSAATEYHVYVRAICQGEGKDEGNSVWNHISFVTNANCPLVQNLNAELTDVNAVRVAWDLAFAEQEKHFQYILADVELDAEGIAAAEPVAVDDTTAFELSELAFEKEYHVYVASVCGATQHSDYVHVVFNTLPACQAVENLAVVRAKHNLVELSWTSAAFAKETQWEVGIVGDESKKQIVSERKVIFIGLEAETAYTAYVKAICSELESSAEATVGFTTAAQPGDCQLVGNGTNGGNMPVSNYDYAYTQIIYDASLIGKGGKITSIELMRSSYANVMNNMKVYLGTTEKATFDSSSDWIAESELTLVYEGSFPVGTAEAPHLVLNLSTPFDYNGTDNLVVAVSNGHGNWNSIQNFYYTVANNTVLCNRADGTPSYADHPGTAAGQSPSAYRTNIQFCFEAKACPDVTALAVSDITTSSAKVSWEPMGSEIAWNVLISDHAITDFSEVEPARVENLYKIYDALLDDQDYFVYVQPADCEGAEFSMVSFRTVASCLAPINAAVVAESIEKHAARVTWVDPNVIPAGSYTVAYAKVNDFDLDDPMIATVQVTDTFADLSGLQADTVYKFAVKADCGGEDLSRYGVAAQFTTPKACFKPTNPDVASVSATSATLFWKDEHDQAGYLVAYGPYNDFDINDPSTYTLANANDTFIVLTELQEATSYRFLVKGDCGEEGLSKEWSTYASFTTTCAAKALPFSEDFENADRFSYCWTKGNIDGNYSYIPTRSGSAKLSGEYGLYLSAYKYVSSYNASYNTDADSAYAVLPELNFGEEGIAAYQMSFNAKAYTSSYGSYYNHILIGVADDDELTNLEIVADKELTDAFAEYEVSFAAQAGNKRIVLFAIVDPESTENSRYGQVYVDDIYVSHVSDCKRPNGLAVSEITDNAATLAWVENGEAEAWQICINGDEENLIDVTENPYILSELTAATAYSVKVRANCGGSFSDWSAEETFATSICAEADKKAIRYELTDTYGDGWQSAIFRIVHKSTGVIIADLTIASGSSNNGTLALCCGEEYEFIWISGTYDSECRLAVYDINDEIIIDQTSAKPTAGVLLDYTMDCVVPTCIKPASLDAEVLSANSVKLDWTAGGEETFFQVVCVLSGEEPNWEGVEPIEALTITIDTLNIDNDYDFYVRAYCGESDHSDFRMVSAHVGYCVPAPTSIDGSGIIAIAFNEEDAYTDIHPTAAPFYADNKAIEFVAHADEIDSILITYSTGYTYGTVIWVDWNKNLAFEASEVVFSGESSATQPTTLSCVFAIPAETELGAYRLRIGGADSFFDGYIKGTSSADPDPCGTGTYTIYEDYTLLIVEKPDEPTGISGAGIDDIVIKRIENNQVVIIRNGEKFTIMGVKIQ